jgi:type I restriction enzyme R subunit
MGMLSVRESGENVTGMRNPTTKPQSIDSIEKVLDDDRSWSFSTELYRKKCELVYQHVYDNYYGEGRSIYDIAS